jgi:hypothetical protein
LKRVQRWTLSSPVRFSSTLLAASCGILPPNELKDNWVISAPTFLKNLVA